MVRQYRIDRFNGMEILVCEVFDKHLFTQFEHDALVRYNEEHLDSPFTNADFRMYVNDELSKDGVNEVFGLRFPIPVYDSVPVIVLRGPVIDNRLASLQVDYQAAALPVMVIDEIRRFYEVLESRHWRDAIDKQLTAYGSLFESFGD